MYVSFPLKLQRVACLIQDVVLPHCDDKIWRDMTWDVLGRTTFYHIIVLEYRKRHSNISNVSKASVHCVILFRSFVRLMYHEFTVIFPFQEQSFNIYSNCTDPVHKHLFQIPKEA